MAEKRITKSYDQEFKSQAVKLSQEIGGHKAANELGIPSDTIYAWVKAFKEGRLHAADGIHTPNRALSLNEEMIELRKRVRDQDKEIRRLKEENEFLEEASAFFAASRRKSDDLIKRDFKSNKPLKKCVTDMTEIKALDGKLLCIRHIRLL